MSGQMSDVRTPEIEIEIEIEREIEIKKDIKIKKQPKKILGTYKNIRLTIKEKHKLIKDFNENKIEELIEKMSSWKKMTGKTYKDDNLALRKWLSNEKSNYCTNNKGKDKVSKKSYEEQMSDMMDML